jgi:hypothetical protein
MLPELSPTQAGVAAWNQANTFVGLWKAGMVLQPKEVLGIQ